MSSETCMRTLNYGNHSMYRFDGLLDMWKIVIRFMTLKSNIQDYFGGVTFADRSTE